MRTRAYRPEAPDCLEGRSLLSGVAGPSADPTVLTRREFNDVPERIQGAFYNFRQGNSISGLHDEINDAVVAVPFGRKDGLAASINSILDTLRRDMHAKDRSAVSTAHNAVLAVTLRGHAGPGPGRKCRRAVTAGTPARDAFRPADGSTCRRPAPSGWPPRRYRLPISSSRPVPACYLG